MTKEGKASVSGLALFFVIHDCRKLARPCIGASSRDQGLLPWHDLEAELPDPIGVLRVNRAIDRADEVVVVERSVTG
jgi:hypothetical protein